MGVGHYIYLEPQDQHGVQTDCDGNEKFWVLIRIFRAAPDRLVHFGDQSSLSYSLFRLGTN